MFEAVNAIQPSWRNEYEITDAIQWLIDHGYVVKPHIHEGWWIDTGKMDDMLEANCAVLDETEPSIAPDAVIENSRDRSPGDAGSGARVIDSIIDGPAIIGEETVIREQLRRSLYQHLPSRDAAKLRDRAQHRAGAQHLTRPRRAAARLL